MYSDRPQSMRDTQPIVAILNTTPETIALLQDVLGDEGFPTVAAYIIEFKLGQRDLEHFFKEHQPEVVLYDIALPYAANWQFFQTQVLARQFLPSSRFVVTTTNRAALELLIGPNDAIELIGRPFDLDVVVQAVKQALVGGATRSSQNNSVAGG